MDEKYPSWSRKRVGRNRVHWVAYDDRAGAEGRQIVDQGYATSLVEADAAARAALAEAGHYGGRRASTAFAPASRGKGAENAQKTRPGPRHYLYTRHHSDQEGDAHVRAHLILRKTPKKVYVTQRSCWTAQLGTEDEGWEPPGRAIALDRARLERDGSAYSTGFRDSAFYGALEEATGDGAGRERATLGRLGLRSPCTLEDIKAAYRRKALEVHPDRGGIAGDFQAVEDAYRRLSRVAEESLT